MPACLVTGGAGFIGSNLVAELLRQNWRVRVLDNFSTGKRSHLDRVLAAAQANTFELVEGDIRNRDDCLNACREVEYVFHQAALRSVPRSVDDPSATNEVNVLGTLNVLQAAVKAGVRRLVYASSSSVYGDTSVSPQQEDHRPGPISPYAVSKLAGEHYSVSFCQVYGLETVSLRYFNVFGPHQDPESKYSALIPSFIQQVSRGEPLEVHGDGLQSRDFTYVGDVVQANLLAAQAANVAGQVFNIACGRSHTVLDVGETIVRIMGRDPGRRHTEARRGDVRHTRADISRAQRSLGYQPGTNLEDGLRRAVEYFSL